VSRTGTVPAKPGQLVSLYKYTKNTKVFDSKLAKGQADGGGNFHLTQLLRAAMHTMHTLLHNLAAGGMHCARWQTLKAVWQKKVY